MTDRQNLSSRDLARLDALAHMVTEEADGSLSGPALLLTAASMWDLPEMTDLEVDAMLCRLGYPDELDGCTVVGR
jgi:hypothetical protein